MNTELLEIINTVLTGKSQPAISSIKPETHLRNDLGFDSFDLAELTVRVEEAFNVDIFANGIVNTIFESKNV
jgi:acyl carrier protein